MQSPLKNFLETVSYLEKKPLEFWDEKIQQKIHTDSNESIDKLKKTLEGKELTGTKAYKVLVFLKKDVTDEFDDLAFVQHLSNLIEIYRLSDLTSDLAKIIDELDSKIIKAKKKLLEHHVALENLNKKTKEMSDSDKQKADLDTLQKIGIFYVLEYTLQVMYEMSNLSDDDKKKLLEDGLGVKAGNLPAFIPLQETFRKELCYKIHDEELRNELLKAFYKFDEVFYNYNEVGWNKWVEGLKVFNLALLGAFEVFGFTDFKAALYHPYGNNIKISDLINKF